MKKLCRNSAIIAALIFGLIGPAPYSHSQAARSDNQQKSRVLTFAERVAYQYAIEEIYWRHRIWPKENPNPKPSLDEVMSRAQIEKKVEEYLRDSQALEDYWQRPITAEQLQAETDRITYHTKQPEVLRELFAALKNDPFVIAECLARGVLTDRLVADLLAKDKTWYAKSARTNTSCGTSMATALENVAYTLPRIFDRDSQCIDDTWTATSIANSPSARGFHSAVWTGSEMIVWGGQDDNTVFNTGGRYNPSTDSWTATTTVNAPDARSGHRAVWTGTEMIVWGGGGNTGGRYNPGTDSWTATSTINAPTARGVNTAVWTGSEMIVWGGYDGSYSNTGGRYNPTNDSWGATSTNNAPAGREFHTAIWTGSEMIVWGGKNANTVFNTGGRYNPSTNSWTATTVVNAPSGRIYHTAVWTGSEIIVWGGGDNTGARYNPGTNSWTATSTINAPIARGIHTAVWTGSEMIIWGGVGDSGVLDSGGRYNPDSWLATSTTSAPDAREWHTAVWAGSEMIVWGGFLSYPNGLNTGGRYCAAPSAPVVESAVSRKTHGAAGNFDIALPLTGTAGIECRTGGATNDYIIVVTFTANVNVTGNPQAQVTSGTGCVGTDGVCNGNVSVNGNIVIVPLTNIANAQTINVRINGVNGAAIDTPETDFTIPMSILIGDTSANGTVNAADVAQTKGRLGQTINATNFRSDVNANGSINASDTAIVKQNSGTSLPP